jgi:hypothetical protein
LRLPFYTRRAYAAVCKCNKLVDCSCQATDSSAELSHEAPDVICKLVCKHLQIVTYEAAWLLLADGGVYICEDTSTSMVRMPGSVTSTATTRSHS